MLDLVTFNVWVGQKLADLHTHLAALIGDTGKPGVIALQEAKRYGGAPIGYARHAFDSDNTLEDRDCVLLVREDIKVAHSGFIHVDPVKGVWVGPKAQHDHHPAHIWPYVVLEVEGVHWTIVDVHRLAGRDHNAAAWVAEGDALREFLKTRSGPVVLLGDWNSNQHAAGPGSPSAIARQYDLHMEFRGVDGVLFRDCTLKATNELASKYGSDVHNPVHFTLTAKGKVEPPIAPAPHPQPAPAPTPAPVVHHPHPAPAPHPQPAVIHSLGAPEVPYVGPPAHFTAGHNKPIHRIVIHSTVSPCVEGGARDIAAYFRTQAAGGSAHYVVDPGETVEVAYDDVICWHAPPNANSLGFEMCDIPGPVPGDARGTAAFKAALRSWRWIKPAQRRMLHRVARDVAQTALAYGVPLIFVDAAHLRQGVHGITTHNEVSQAWHQSTHWDPGFWPRRRFMKLVHQYASELRAGHDPKVA